MGVIDIALKDEVNKSPCSSQVASKNAPKESSDTDSVSEDEDVEAPPDLDSDTELNTVRDSYSGSTSYVTPKLQSNEISTTSVPSNSTMGSVASSPPKASEISEKDALSNSDLEKKRSELNILSPNLKRKADEAEA